MPDTAQDLDPGTPIYDAVLSDRLLEAARAEQDAAAFRAALDRGQRHAIAQQAEQQAGALVRVRTAELTAQRDALARRAGAAGGRLDALAAWHAGEAICRACAEPMPCTTTRVLAGEPAPVVPEPAAPEPEPAPRNDVVTLEARAVAASTAAAPDDPAPDDPAPDDRAADDPEPAVAAARPARDGGPAAGDVPSVPSMKDLFSSTRAAGWLDNLLGVKR